MKLVKVKKKKKKNEEEDYGALNGVHYEPRGV
jgi:hypothetical protein